MQVDFMEQLLGKELASRVMLRFGFDPAYNTKSHSIFSHDLPTPLRKPELI